ncbi:hypothetical protein EVA_10074 [gut metagenome]|uniref:Uncharacterized protein n=1 Tax=gut metagenome TaxID=749906 RepID=J9G4M8_9ZZZZ
MLPQISIRTIITQRHLILIGTSFFQLTSKIEIGS